MTDKMKHSGDTIDAIEYSPDEEQGFLNLVELGFDEDFKIMAKLTLGEDWQEKGRKILKGHVKFNEYMKVIG